MTSIGIVRRIDDLGRIVIPRELRERAGIEDGEALEMFPYHGGMFFKKLNEEDVTPPADSSEKKTAIVYSGMSASTAPLLLTTEQIKLLNWLAENGWLAAGARVAVMDSENLIIP